MMDFDQHFICLHVLDELMGLGWLEGEGRRRKASGRWRKMEEDGGR